MKRSGLRTTVLFVAISGFPAVPAVADDFAPPWWRGGVAFGPTVFAEWEFQTPPANWNFIAPETFSFVSQGYSLYGGFATHANVDQPSQWTWTDGDGDGAVMPAIGTGGASISFDVQNALTGWFPNKWIRLQVTWSGDIAPSTTEVRGYIGDRTSLAHLMGSTVVDARHYYQDWEFRAGLYGFSSPEWERFSFHLAEGTTLDEVVIDTMSWFPSPGTVMAFGVAGIGLLFRRRRAASFMFRS